MGSNDGELRTLPSDLAGEPDANVVKATMRHVIDSVRTMTPLVTSERIAAEGGGDTARLAWAVRVGPVCQAVSETVQALEAPTPMLGVLKSHYVASLNAYVFMAAAWVESAGAPNDKADALKWVAVAQWKAAMDAVRRAP